MTNWYVIQAVTGRENKTMKTIQNELKEYDLEKYVNRILIPKETIYKVQNGKKIKSEKSYFPGYIMLEADMNDELYGVIRKVDGVCGFLGGKGTPTPLKENEVKRFLKDIDYLEEKEISFDAYFHIGENVKIINGPFNTFVGEIYSLDNSKKKMIVNVSIFGRKTPVELNFEFVEKI